MKKASGVLTRLSRRRPVWMAVGIVQIALFGWAAIAIGDEMDILQIKQAFEPGSASVASGQTLNFVNSDDVNHNLQLVAPGGVKTDFGVEKPGETTKITFAAPGEYLVICGIHPRMKMKVQVIAPATAKPS